MKHSLISFGGGCLLLLAGCTQSKDELRTYSEGADGTAAIAQPGDSVDEPTSSETTQTAGIGKSPVASASPPAAAVRADAGESSPAAATSSPTRPPRVPLPQRMASPNGPNDSSFTSLTAADKPREIKLLVPEKDFPRLDGGKTWRVSFDDIDLLKVLNMEPVPADCVDHFPDWLKSLDGQQVRIRGFMIPDTRAEGLTGFNMARDTQLCCFGRAPKLYDVFPVWLKPGTTTKYIHLRPFDVVGRFAIRPYAYKGQLQSLYEIEDAELIPN